MHFTIGFESHLFQYCSSKCVVVGKVITDHKFNMETLVVHEICHEGLEALGLRAHIFEVVEGIEDDLMTSLHKADCS